MKSFAYLAYLAAVAASAALPFQIEIITSFIVVVGLGILLAQDYTEPRPLRLPGRPKRGLRPRFFPPALTVGAGRITA